ncbi:MAG: hypothetical protein WBB27_00500 [Maribacter sp.]
MNENLDEFGKFIIQNMRDKQMDNINGLLEGKWKGKDVENLQKQLSKFNGDEKKVISDLVEDILNSTMHDLLFAIQESNDLDTGLKVMIHDKNVAELSDGLQGEIFGEEGWTQRFSRYQPQNEHSAESKLKGIMNKLFGKKSNGS